MKKYKFKKLDAFATDKSSGNPAGCILLDSLSEITEIEMLQIAKELKGFVNEVGYAAQVGDREFDLRYYSSEKEVDFCGHATIAIMYDLIKTNSKLSDFDTLLINTNKGQLEVENRVLSEDAVYIMSPVPERVNTSFEKEELASNLRIQESDIDERYPISTINAGLTTLIVPIKSLDAILAIKPDIIELANYYRKIGIDLIEVFTPETTNSHNNFRTRVFSPLFGYIEDPATGSGNSALGYYLVSNDLWRNEKLQIEQNGLRENYNVVKLQKKVDEQGKLRVCFGGNAVLRVDGEYLLKD